MKDNPLSVAGVYLITNMITGERYVGASANIWQRWINHQSPSAAKKSKVDFDIRKYGKENFKVDLLLRAGGHGMDWYKALPYFEKYFMALLNPEYNVGFGNCPEVGNKDVPLSSPEYVCRTRKHWDRNMAVFRIVHYMNCTNKDFSLWKDYLITHKKNFADPMFYRGDFREKSPLQIKIEEALKNEKR